MISYLRNPLYRNGTFIFLSSLVTAIIGFFFWMFAGRIYPKEDVGLAIALISSANLIVLISRLGLDQSIIRFFPDGNKKGIFGIALLVSTSIVLIFGIIFIIGIDFWSPELRFIRANVYYYFLFLITSSMLILAGYAFMAIRRAEYTFIQNIFTSPRLLLIFPLVLIGALGIFISITISFCLAIIISIVFLIKKNILPPRLDIEFLKRSFQFSISNYIANLLTAAPVMIFPIMILNILGAENAADYYISFAIVSLLFIIPQAYSLSLFVEGSHGESLRRNLKRSLKIIFLLLIPGIFVVILLGESLLGWIGAEYLQALSLLRILAISSFLFTFFSVFLAIIKVQKDVKGILFFSSFTFILLILSSYVFMIEYGIIGIGYAWLFSYGLGSVIIVARTKIMHEK